MLEGLTLSMAGSGNWRGSFPGESAYDLYRRLYPDGMPISALDGAEQNLVDRWEKPGFARKVAGRVQPQIPVMTRSDCTLFDAWYGEAAEKACRVIAECRNDYLSMARRLASAGECPEDYLLTILVCGYTLDVGVLDELQQGIMGKPPERAGSGTYFIWGQDVPSLSRYHYGVNSMGMNHMCLHFIWGRRITRMARGRSSLRIPVFDAGTTREIENLCGHTSLLLAEAFTRDIAGLRSAIDRSTFKQCPRGDTLCMLFHIGYEKMAEILVAKSLLPDFPVEADDAWGIWIDWQE